MPINLVPQVFKISCTQTLTDKFRNHKNLDFYIYISRESFGSDIFENNLKPLISDPKVSLFEYVKDFEKICLDFSRLSHSIRISDYFSKILLFGTEFQLFL